MGKIIEIDENLYKSISSSLSNLASTINSSRGNLGPCFGGKLLNYYNSNCDTDIDDELLSASDLATNTGLNINASIEAYKMTDDGLSLGLDALIDEIFSNNIGDVKTNFDETNNSGDNQSLEERKAYLDKLLKSYETLLDDLKNEFNLAYSEYYGHHCLDGIDPQTYAVLETLMVCFVNSGSYDGDFGSFNQKTKTGSYTLDQLQRFNDFVKEKKLFGKLDAYYDGKSWHGSGMSEFNDIIITNLTGDNNYNNEFKNSKVYKDYIDDCVEASFLGYFYYKIKTYGIDVDINCQTLGGNISDLLYGEKINIDQEEIVKVKSLMSEWYNQGLDYKARHDDETRHYGLLDYIDTQVNDYNSYINDIQTLSSTIYNYKQAALLLPYQSYLKDESFDVFFNNDFNNIKDDYIKELGDKANYLTDEEVALYAYLSKINVDPSGYISALTDTINNRKGMVEAVEYIKSLDKNGYNFFDDGIKALLSGFGDGVVSFAEGLAKLWPSEGVRTANDYSMYYKIAILMEPEKYKEELKKLGIDIDIHLTQAEKVMLNGTYNVFKGVGNMFIPQALSLAGMGASFATGNPTFAKVLRGISTALIGLSAGGNASNEARLKGHDLLTSYLYGALSGGSEVLFERLGGVFGIGNDVNLAGLKGKDFFKKFIYSMFKEGREEFFQEYFDAAIGAVVLGEPFDLTKTTGDALIAGIYGMLVAGVMNSGSTVLIKIGDKVLDFRGSDLAGLDLEKLKDQDSTKVLDELYQTQLAEAMKIVESENINTFDKALDYIRKNGSDNVNKSRLLDATIKSMIKDTNNDSEAIIKLYSELSKILHYDEKATVDGSMYGRLNSDMNLLNMPDNDSLICSEFSSVFRDILIRAGFDPENVRIMPYNKAVPHRWVEVDLLNGEILIADATDYMSGRIDFTSAKAGLDFVGLAIIDEQYSGTRINDVYQRGIIMINGIPTPIGSKGIDIIKAGRKKIGDIVNQMGPFNLGEYEVVKGLFGDVEFEDVSLQEKLDLINHILSDTDLTSYELTHILNKLNQQFTKEQLPDGSFKITVQLRSEDGTIHNVTIEHGKITEG